MDTDKITAPNYDLTEDYYEPMEYLETNEACPECGKMTLFTYHEANGPDDSRQVWVCKSCGLTESE